MTSNNNQEFEISNGNYIVNQSRDQFGNSSGSDDEEMSETEINSLISKIDPNRLIYDLKELKPLQKLMFFYKRDYIKYGYRANPDMTVTKCTKSIFMCHCETGNIWTHMGAALYFAIQLILIIVRYIELVSNQTNTPAGN